MIDSTTATSSGDVASSVMNCRSILSWCTANPRSWPRLVNPAPKSSIDTCKPRARSAATTSHAVSGFSVMALSVISMTSFCGGQRLSVSTSSTMPSRALSNETGLMLTATEQSRPCARQRLASPTAVSSTQRVSAWIRLVRSAMGMNSAGNSSPRSGWSQRSSASKPIRLRELAASTGW